MTVITQLKISKGTVDSAFRRQPTTTKNAILSGELSDEPTAARSSYGEDKQGNGCYGGHSTPVSNGTSAVKQESDKSDTKHEIVLTADSSFAVNGIPHKKTSMI